MKYFLYIIQTIDNTLYCGITKDVFKRFKQHLEGKGAKYLKCHKPKEIVYITDLKDKSAALKEEYRIKNLIKKDKIELIKNNIEKTKKFLYKS